MEAVCYMCGKPATSREHVPPLCFFPERKDIKEVYDIDFRVNLITVPSCEEHNSKKSIDDEFLLACLAGVVGNNGVGYVHTKTKVSKIMNRKGDKFLDAIIKDPKKRIIEIGDKEYPVLLGSPDYLRIIRCIKHIAYGLYFHEFGYVFKGDVTPFLGFVDFKDEQMKTLKEKVLKWHKEESKNITWKGANSLVFQYQFIPPDKNGIWLLAMIFYQGTNIYVSMMPEEALNNNGHLLFIREQQKSGFPVTINFDDGTIMKFNQ